MTNHLSENFYFLIFCVVEHTAHGLGAARVKDPESIADHMYRMATLSFLVDSKSGLNKDRSVPNIHGFKPQWGGFGKNWGVSLSYMKNVQFAGPRNRTTTAVTKKNKNSFR